MKRIVLSMIRFYQVHLSRFKRVGCCRFVPTCSEYAFQAVARYGAFKGLGLAILRILKCNPFFDGGYDPLK